MLGISMNARKNDSSSLIKSLFTINNTFIYIFASVASASSFQNHKAKAEKRSKKLSLSLD